ncbi:MAG: hypothetical protein MUF13_14175, partial [Akkermansiaceae bacterium]|nr:hypothetical protein [Akkermansiaceae bacterium]
MKKRATWWMIPAVALSLAACEKKTEEVKAPEPAPAAATPAEPTPPAVPEAPPVVKVPEMSAEERAAKLGFVKHLPKETEVVMAFHNGTKSAERIKSSKLWKLVETEMGAGAFAPGGAEEMDEELPLPEVEQDADAADAADEIAPPADATDAGIPEEDPMGPATLFGTEFTVALGKSVGEQTDHLLTLNRRSSYFQMRGLAKTLVASAKSGDFSEVESALASQFGPELFKDLLADKESGVELFEKMRMPPLYLAFRTKSSERDPAAQQLASLTENLGMFGEEIVESIEVEKAGQKFAGKKINGAKIAESMKESRGDLESMMDAASVDKILAAIAKRDLVVLSGTIGDYVVLFIGASTDDLVFAPDIASSMVSNDSLKFSDPYASKELAAVIYG